MSIAYPSIIYIMNIHCPNKKRHTEWNHYGCTGRPTEPERLETNTSFLGPFGWSCLSKHSITYIITPASLRSAAAVVVIVEHSWPTFAGKFPPTFQDLRDVAQLAPLILEFRLEWRHPSTLCDINTCLLRYNVNMQNLSWAIRSPSRKPSDRHHFTLRQQKGASVLCHVPVCLHPQLSLLPVLNAPTHGRIFSFLLVHVLDKSGSLPVFFPVQIIYRIISYHIATN